MVKGIPMASTRLIFFVMIIFASTSCRTTKEAPAILVEDNEIEIEIEMNEPIPSERMLPAALPALIIYKTRTDCQFMVPVMLNDDKTEVVSFPHPSDLYYNGVLAVPLNLDRGYLMDVRGISLNTAFLHITYEQYAAMASPPDPKALYAMIYDKDPMIEIWSCGPRFGLDVDTSRANALIREGSFAGCIRLK
jgi:hypothetical protein